MAQERRQLAAAEVLGTTLNQQHVKEEDRLSLLMPFSQERGRNFLELPTAFPLLLTGPHWIKCPFLKQSEAGKWQFLENSQIISIVFLVL